MKSSIKGFTLVEILIGLSLTAAIFLVATSLVVNVFYSNLKSKHKEVLAQVKNDLSTEFGNTVRWADSVSYENDVLIVDSMNYRLDNGQIYRDELPLTPEEVEITKFSVSNFQSVIKMEVEMKIKNNPSITDNLSLFLSIRSVSLLQ